MIRDGRSPAPPGVNIVGYFRAELGVGEAARLLTKAVEAAGIPFVTIPWDRTRSRQDHPFAGEAATDPRYDTTILCVNADQVRAFAEHAGPSFFEGRYTIGQWMWEVETFPETMFEGFDYVDEVWVASEHAARAVGAVSPKPVLLMPPPLVEPEYTRRARSELGLPETFLFLFVFDFLSVFERKNPLGLVEAFTRAFAPGEGPSLVIKSINGDKRPELLERLRRAAQRGDITIQDGYVSPDTKNAMIASADAFVSLHRSEGLGLTMAEAMLLGKPVVATAYSGNMLFMNERNSFGVPYDLTTIPDGCDPYPPGGQWADPNVDAAAAILRRVFTDASARAIGERGRADLLRDHSPAVRGRQVARRIEQVRGWRAPGIDVGRAQPRTGSGARPAAPRRLPRDDPGAAFDALASVEELIARGPALEYGSRFGEGGRMFRRGLLRVLRPYAWHQRQVASALVAAIKEIQRRQSLTSIETVVWLIDRVGRLQGEVGRLQARLPAKFDDVAGRLEMLSEELDSLREALAESRRGSEESEERARLT